MTSFTDQRDESRTVICCVDGIQVDQESSDDTDINILGHSNYSRNKF